MYWITDDMGLAVWIQINAQNLKKMKKEKDYPINLMILSINVNKLSGYCNSQ